MQMTDNKISMDKKKNSKKNNNDAERIKERKTQSKKMKQMKKKRLIIRNLSFKISEDELRNTFSKFGEVLDIAIPLTKDGRKRGFAFIQYKDAKSQIKAMKEMNFKKIHDRPIAIDFAVDKTTYQSLQNSTKPSVSLEEKKNLSETTSNHSVDSDDEDIESNTHSPTDVKTDIANVSENEDEVDSKVKAFFEEFDTNDQMDSENESSDETSDDMEEDQEEESESYSSIKKEVDNSHKNNQQFKKKHSEDVSEGKTVFIRNISFNITEEDLKEVVQEYGDIEYCLFCKDPLTEQFKGSSFVKFKEKECADKLIQESSKEPGILIDNRVLNCTYALSREELSKQNVSHKVKDKRNLNLLKYGMISYGSKEAEGVSKTDMAKRAQLEMVKKQKLKNVNFFVSDKRLMIHNLPKNINDKDLYSMFKKAAGEGAVIVKARVMRDFKKTDAQGVPVSRGFGFVSFTQHEHAFKALQNLNNNPRIFTSNMRPIVEFSIENKVALLSQERKREKLRMRSKRKVDEDKNSKSEERFREDFNQVSSINIKRKKMDSWQKHFPKSVKTNYNQFQKVKESKSGSLSTIKTQKMKFKEKRNKKSNTLFDETQQSTDKKERNKRKDSICDKTQEIKSKKKQKKHLKGKKGKVAVVLNAQERNRLSVLTNKYKEKLMNKYS